jgi:EmrB/QacA subfamily drug resistance transporter
MRMPCDERAMRPANPVSPCEPEARKWVLAATILGSSLAFIDSTVVNVALPALQAGFRASLVDVEWVVESYGLFLGALILAGGSLGDLFGRRLIFVVGTTIFAVASVACGLAQSIEQLIIARSFQGAGAALLVPGSLAIISASFDERDRGKAIGTWSGFTAITTAVGPVLGGWMVQHATWRSVFFLNPPLAAAVIGISIWQIPESRNPTARLVDWLGATLATMGLGGVVFGSLESANLGWRSPLVFGSLTAGLGLLVAFAFAEAHVKEPMFPPGLFACPDFGGANLLTLLLYSALGIFFFLFPLNLIQVQKYSPTKAGAAVLPFILLMFFLSRWSGGLVAHYGRSRPLVIGPLIAGLGFGLCALPSLGNGYWRSFFPALLVLGFGTAVTVAPLTTVVMNSVSQDRAGIASGVNNAVARVAGVLAIAVFGIVMVKAFGSRLDLELSRLALPSEVLGEIQADEIKLAGVQVSDSIDARLRPTVEKSIGEAFVFGFRIVMGSCAGLAVASAGIAGRMIGKGRPERGS